MQSGEEDGPAPGDAARESRSGVFAGGAPFARGKFRLYSGGYVWYNFNNLHEKPAEKGE